MTPFETFCMVVCVVTMVGGVICHVLAEALMAERRRAND